MEENKGMRKELISGARIALIFALMLFFVSNVVKAAVKDGIDGNYVSAFTAVIVTVIIVLLHRKELPEGWFCASKEKMEPRAILSFLGVFALYHLCNRLISFGGTEGLPGNSWSFVLYMGILIPVCEELVFRGVIMGKYFKYGKIFALISTAILFGAYHLNLIQLVSASLLGLLFCYVGMRYCIVWCILLHFFNNGLIVSILSLLWKASGNSFLTTYGTIIVCAIFTIVGLVAFLRSHLIRDIRQYFSDDEKARGPYKTVFLNGWFIVLMLLCIGMTVMIFTIGPEMGL